VENINKKLQISVGNFSELSEQEQKLFEHAAKVRCNAQAPYSNYSVGVAVLSDQNTIHVGAILNAAPSHKRLMLNKMLLIL
jgi:cytidine deaminase